MTRHWSVRPVLAAITAVLGACAAQPEPGVSRRPESGERFFASLTQLTFGGQNAEAYFSPDGARLIFQRQESDTTCDQQYVMNVDGSDVTRVSNGLGRTTCGYFLRGGSRILYSSTFRGDERCPPRPDYSRGYVWPLYDFDIFAATAEGGVPELLFGSPGYDAEATVSPDGSSIVFTSTRDGDLDIYAMNVDGSDVRRLTSALGYDGGPFYSPDGRSIVYRAWHPETPSDVEDYRALLAAGLVRPTRMEIWVMNADGSEARQVTSLGGANFAPSFHPDGRRIIFASNHHDPQSRNFDLYLVHRDGTGLTRVTSHGEFDGFPMFSPDGGRLVFAANRFGRAPGETNIFLAEWRDP